MCDAGHAAGPRMRDYGGFGDPASAKTALLIESGQHWERRAAEVATDVMLRFLIAARHLDARRCRAARRARISTRIRASASSKSPKRSRSPATASNSSQDFRGLEVLSPKGTLIGRDNGREVRTPYDDCVLIMPSRRLAKGQTAVRLGRYVE